MAEQGISAVFETGAQKQGKEGRPGEHSLGSTGGMDRGGGVGYSWSSLTVLVMTMSIGSGRTARV